MGANDRYTLDFSVIGTADHDRVGGKCASLGEMTQAGVAVPPGFAVTIDAYKSMLDHHGLKAEIDRHLEGVDPDDIDQVDRAAQAIRIRIRSHKLPPEVEAAIRTAYAGMCAASGIENMPVAVRSSATAEDLPDASFAGQQDTYLWVQGADSVVYRVRDCWASLYTTRAVAYREKNGIPQVDVLMSVAVQKMVNARTAGVRGSPSRIVTLMAAPVLSQISGSDTPKLSTTGASRNILWKTADRPRYTARCV